VEQEAGAGESERSSRWNSEVERGLFICAGSKGAINEIYPFLAQFQERKIIIITIMSTIILKTIMIISNDYNHLISIICGSKIFFFYQTFL